MSLMSCLPFPPSLQVFKDEKYLKDAVECGEVIWQRGLLRKGYGICHGTAGNAYSFLTLYQLTQEKKYLYRACKVTQHTAVCVCDEGLWSSWLLQQCCPPSDLLPLFE